MDEFLGKLRREQANTALLPLFFVSGGTALVYQTLWNRDLHLVFGTSTFAIATVLAAFMAGLAMGGALMARVADKIRRPLRAYGLLEAGIGIYALGFSTLVTWMTPVYLEIWRVFHPPPVLFGLVQFVLVGVLLILPTAAMGATLPLLARFATSQLGSAGDRVGTLYAVNTAGAVAGTYIAGFYLLPTWGLWTTTMLAAGANLLLGGSALLLDNWVGVEDVPVVEAEDTAVFLPRLRAVGLVMALAGFSSLVYEVAWTRVLGLMVGASVYSFSLMLLAFLVGIAIGGKVGGRLSDVLLLRYGAVGVLVGLAGAEVGVAGLSYGLMYVFPELPFWYVWVFDFMGGADDPSQMWLTSLVVSGLVMTPPALLMGVAFPMAIRAVVGDTQALGEPVGNLYAANTIGGVIGAFGAGFVLLPTIGIQGTIFLAAVVNLVAAAMAVVAARDALSRPLWAAGPALIGMLCVAFVFARPPWDKMLMTSGMYHYVTQFEDHSREGIMEYSVGLYELVYYAEGLSTVVTVAANTESDNLWLANNGKVDASTTSDMPTQVLCSLLPMQFAGATDDVLVIGLASGITAGALTTIPTINKIDIVELEPVIREAATYFRDFNNDVLNDPRVELIANDGRNHLMIAPEHTYDVIVSEPSNPWITGVSNLFTREFWEMGKTRLKPGGVWSQWVQMYGMDDHDLKSLLATFASVYPHVLLYSTIEDSDLVLVGSDAPLIPDAAHAHILYDSGPVQAQLRRVDIDDPYDLIAMFQMDRSAILAATKGSPLNTDDNMRIEYNAPLNLHRDTHGENMRLLLKDPVVPSEAMHSSQDWAALARAFERRNDSVRAMLSYTEAIRTAENGADKRVYQVEAKAILDRVTAAAQGD